MKLPTACALVTFVAIGCSRSEPPLARRSEPLVAPFAPLPEPHGDQVCALLRDGSGLVAGGATNGSGALTEAAQRLDPTKSAWTAVASLGAGRWAAAAVTLVDGRVLVAGGAGQAGSSGTILSSAELFDPKAGTWTPVARMFAARFSHAMVALPDGSALVLGGAGGTTSATGVERYDPVLDRWTPWPSIQSHPAPSAVALPDGRVLVIGDGLATADLVDPSGPSVATTGPLLARRSGGVLTLLPDGRALAVGGNDEKDAALSTTEIFDPSSNTWRAGPTLTHPHFRPSVGRLTSGATLVAGGPSGLDVISPDASSAVSLGFLSADREAPCVFPVGDGLVVAGGSVLTGFASDVADLVSAAPVGAACADPLDCASGSCGADHKCAAFSVLSDGGTASSGETGGTPVVIGGAAKACVRASDCSSGHCVDGVCCDSACQALCHSCALPGSPGRCTAEPAGVDLRGECGASGTCTGTCGPAASCIGALEGSQCAPSRCLSESTGVGPAICAARGARCPTDAVSAFDCGAYGCDPAFGACRSECGSSVECAGGFLCDAPTHTCVAPSAPASSAGGCGVPASAPLASGATLATLLMSTAVLARRRSRVRRRPR